MLLFVGVMLLFVGVMLLFVGVVLTVVICWSYVVTSKIPVRWPGQCYGFTLSLIFKYCGGI